MSSHITIFCCLFVLFSVAHGRYLPISDGVNDFNGISSSSYLLVKDSQNGTCEQTYGFMPCTTTWEGNLFLIVVYGYLMYVSATFLSDGSEMLLEIMGPGIVGGLFLPMLGALPDAMLILVSGLSGSKAEAQSQVSVGIGLLAGSTVMLVTVVWGVCVIVGKCDLGEADNIAVDGTDTKGFNLTRSGVSADYWTCYAAMIMGLSVIPFIVLQLLQLIGSNSGRRIAVLIALVLSVAMLISYCTYQILQPWIQRRRLAYAKHKHVISKILKHLKQRALGRMLDENGKPERNIVNTLFKTIDIDNDGYISPHELRAFVIGIQLEDIDFSHDDAVSKVMAEFDQSNDNFICPEEFFNGINKWISEAKLSGEVSSNGGAASNIFNAFHSETKVDHKLLGGEEWVGEESDEVIENAESPKEIMLKAIGFLLLGTIVAAAFADPLVDVVNNFSSATRIPSFFISFILLPLATNSSEAVSAIIFSGRKKLRTTSLALSELYGSATMNNVLCLSVFLALVYARGLAWNFTAEVLVILLVCLVMSLFGSFRTTFPLWTCIFAFLLYPLSLALVYVLDYVFGWS